MNPAELRQTVQSISRRLESTNSAVQENIYFFTEHCIDPCLSAFKECIKDFTAPCRPGRDEQSRRKRGRTRGRAELDFNFYEDWDDDENHDSDLVGWSNNDELESLLSGSRRQDEHAGQPRRQPTMSYGSRGRAKKSPGHKDGEPDPTIIPSSSYLGFLERLPFKLGGNLRYKPSAADLQENPGRLRGLGDEGDLSLETAHNRTDTEALINPSRLRSATIESRSTTNSLSSRGDLIPSDEEADAVPLDDEFATALERRTTATTPEDRSSRRSRSSRKSRTPRTSTRTLSSLSIKNLGSSRRVSSIKSHEDLEQPAASPIPSLTELEKEQGLAKEKDESELAKEKEPVQESLAERDLASVDAALQADSAQATTSADRTGGNDSTEDEASTRPDPS